MDRIRIWFKNEWASKYIENILEWKFEADYLVIKLKKNSISYNPTPFSI